MAGESQTEFPRATVMLSLLFSPQLPSADFLPAVWHEEFSVERLLGWIHLDLGDRTISRLATAIVLTILLWILHLSVNLIVGLRQKQEANGTWRRLFFVAAIVAGMQTLPVTLVFILTAVEFSGINERSLSVTLPIVWFLNFLCLISVMRPPFEFIRTSKALPIVEDVSFLDRVREIAVSMQLPTPPVRIWRTGGSELQVMAAVGGLPAPSLVVFDGMMHRLNTDEQDAIIGHELAHLVNHSLWFLISPFPFAAMVAIVAATLITPTFALMTGYTSYLLVQRPISRYFEYDCDRRAADVLGYRAMSRALAKLHAAHFVKNQGLLSYIAYATATHPSRVERMAALSRHAPADDAPNVDWSTRDVARRRFAAMLAYAIGLGLAVVAFVWKCRLLNASVPVFVMTLVAAIPLSAMLIAQWRSSRRHRKRFVRSVWRPVKQAFLVMCLAFAGFRALESQLERGPVESEASRPPLWLTLLEVSCVLMTLAAILFMCFHAFRIVLSRRLGLAQKCGRILQDHEFDKIIELAKQYPKPFTKDVNLRHTLALARALSGDRATAVGELFQIIHDEPRMHESAILLCMLALDDGHPDRALPLCKQLASALPHDPDPHILKASALRMLRRFDEAEATVRAALEVDPEAGYAYAVQAAIEWERGNLEAGEAAFWQSEEYVPGAAHPQYLRAEQAVRSSDVEHARGEVRKAVAASNANPFALLQKRVRRLAEQVGLDTTEDE